MINILQQKIRSHKNQIEAFFAEHSKGLMDPIYASADIRNAGFKIAPIDTNIFPSGWNNLCPNYSRNATMLFQQFFQNNYPNTKKILIIAESHTKNIYYFSNLKNLQRILELAGFEAKIGTLREDIEAKIEFQTVENETITEFRIKRRGDILVTNSFEPDIYLLNNDLSAGIPDILKDLKKPLIPSPVAGWHTRRKSDHFKAYHLLSQKLAQDLDIDHWFICTYFEHEDGVDFAKKQGIERIAEKVATILKKIQQKYDEYGIKDKPYVFVKNEAGTYGIAAMTAESPEDILTMNRKQRNSMNIGKNNIKVSRVIIQEGIPTVDRFKDQVAEPVIYMVGNQIAGGFLRLHSEKDPRNNLNAPGMTFTKMCFHEMKDYTSTYSVQYDINRLFDIFKILARLASVAAGYEIKELLHTHPL